MLYQRHLDPSGNDSLAHLVRRIPAPCRVLELGPATGYLTRHLKEVLGCVVDAIELSPVMAEQARPWCRNLLVGDVESLEFETQLANGPYDTIICADVVEHLRDPWSLVRRLGGLLEPDGRLLLSVPNVGYLGVLVDLLRGNFSYRDEGLLDRSHLRFFTFDSLRDLLEQGGWYVWAAEQVNLSLTDSEFRTRIETLSPTLREELLARPDALCYQWIVEARRVPAKEPFRPSPQVSEDLFQVRLFWRANEPTFDYPRDSLAWAHLGRAKQSVSLNLPADQRAMALRLSDRVGFVRLDAIRCYDGEHTLTWAWQQTDGELPTREAVDIEFAGDHDQWFVRRSESFLVPDIPLAAVVATRCVVVDISAPVTADYLMAKEYWESPEGLPSRLAAAEAANRRLALRRAGEPAEPARRDLPLVVHLLSAGGGGVDKFVHDLCLATAHAFRHLVVRVGASSCLVEDVATANYRLLPGIDQVAAGDLLASLHASWIHLHSTGSGIVDFARRLFDCSGGNLGITLHDVLFAAPAAFERRTWSGGDVVHSAALAELFAIASFVTAPSDYVVTLAQDVYRIAPLCVPNGILPVPRLPWDDGETVDIDGHPAARRVAAIGALGGHKGGARLFDIAGHLSSDVVVIVFGFLDGQLETGWASDHHRSLADHPAAPRIFVTGAYAPADLPRLFSRYRPHVVLFPGSIPESFSYTLSEVWSSAAIPVVPSCGAMVERASPATALLVDPDDISSVVATLDEWTRPAAAERRARMRADIGRSIPQLVPALADMAKTFLELYSELSTRPPAPADLDALDRFSMLCEMNFDPSQFRAELRQLVEENRILQRESQERQQWSARLESSISELKARNEYVESQLAEFVQAHQDLMARTHESTAESARLVAELTQRIGQLEGLVGQARLQLGNDESCWIRNGRIVRLARRVPGLIGALDLLAKLWRGK